MSKRKPERKEQPDDERESESSRGRRQVPRPDPRRMGPVPARRGPVHEERRREPI